MKKLIVFTFALLLTFVLSGCNSETEEQITLNSEESFVTLSYLSGALIDLDSSATTAVPVANEQTSIDGELDTVNEYMDSLKALIDNGTQSFGDVSEEESDNELYDYMITFTVTEIQYTIYYNVNIDTGIITGVLIIDDVEYIIEATNTLEDSDTLCNPTNEDGDQTKSKSTNNDLEEKMVLTAYNGDDYVKVIYTVSDTETKFHLSKSIDNEVSELFMKISVEDNHYKIRIDDEENYYVFKKDIEDDKTIYKLNYSVDGVKGVAIIYETVGDDGELVYEYKVTEGNIKNTYRKGAPYRYSQKGSIDNDKSQNQDI